MTERQGPVKSGPRTGRLTRHDWLEAALRLVVRTGVEGLRVQELADALHSTTGSLYWHFRDRSELLDALLEHWVQRSTQEIVDRALAAPATPEARLLTVMREVLDNEATTSDLAFRAWARTSRRAAAAVSRVDRIRERTAAQLFEEMGFEGVERELRVRMLVCYESCERVVFPGLTQAHRARLLERRHRLLCARTEEP